MLGQRGGRAGRPPPHTRLGDRHGENILLDEATGDSVHVDFNCILDKVWRAPRCVVWGLGRGRLLYDEADWPARSRLGGVAALAGGRFQGKEFSCPEVVPFRLTNNMVDALGASGYVGAYHLRCHVSCRGPPPPRENEA